MATRPPLRTTRTYTTLEIGPKEFEHILGKIREAGEEYVHRYYELRIAEGIRIIHFTGSEVALVTSRTLVRKKGNKRLE